MKSVVNEKLLAMALAMLPMVTLAAKPDPKANSTIQQVNKEAVMQQAPAEVKQDLVLPAVKPDVGDKKLPAVNVKDIKKPVHIPAPQMKTEVRQSLPAVQHEKVTAPSINKVPGNKFENTNALRQANQARGLKESKDAMDALRNVQGMPERGKDVNPDLGLGGKGGLTGPGGRAMDMSKLPGHDTGEYGKPAGGEYLPDLPSNQDKGPGNAPLRPSGDLRSIMGGAAANNPNEGVSTSERRNEDGSTTFVKETTDAQGRTTSSETTFRKNPNGDLNEHTVTTLPNGWRHEQNTTYDAGTDRFNYRRQAWVNPEGETVYERSRDDLSGPRWHSNGVAPRFSQDPNDPSYSPEFAAWASQFDHSAKKGAPEINKVNPGPDGATPNPQAPRIVPGKDQLVVNPDPNNVSGQGRLPDAAVYRQQLRDKVRGPGGQPGDDPEVVVPGK